jgi:hypothetical protein
MASSPSSYISQEHFGDFENHIRGIGYMLLRKKGYDGQGIGKRIQDIISPIIIAMRVKNEAPGFGGTKENAITTKITFVKVKDVANLTCSLE